MDKLLKPSKLAIDPNGTSAAKEWKHWVRTFRSYVSRFAAVSSNEEADAEKLAALINCATPEVFEYIDDCETYVEAEALLQKLYVKQPNEIFARIRCALRSKTLINRWQIFDVPSISWLKTVTLEMLPRLKIGMK